MIHRGWSYANRVVLGAVTVVLAIGVVVVAVSVSAGQYASIYMLRATFPRTGQGLDETSTVKLRGVTVGTVAGIKLLAGGQADITLHIDDGIRVPDSVSASVEPLSVFGPKFIRLDPGDHEASGPYLGDGARITRTQGPTEVIDVLGAASRLLDAVDPLELGSVVHTLARGLDGTGPAIGRIADHGAELAITLEASTAQTAALLHDLAVVASGLSSRGVALNSISRDSAAALPTLTEHGDDLGRLLDATSRVSRELSSLIDAHATAIDRIMLGLVPAAKALFDQLACIPQFLRANTDLIGALGQKLLIYELGDGHVAGVVSGPYSMASMMTPPGAASPVPVAACSAAP